MQRAPKHRTHDHVTAAIADLTRLEPLYDEASKRMDDALPGIPAAQSFDPGGRSSDGTSSTERIGTRLAETGDKARALCQERDAIAKRLRIDAARLRKLMEANSPHPADPKAKAAAEKANVVADPLCEHCTPWVRSLGIEPVHRTGTVNGNLDKPMALGLWCYEFVRRTGRLPVRDEVERHDNGQRVRVSA